MLGEGLGFCNKGYGPYGTAEPGSPTEKLNVTGVVA